MDEAGAVKGRDLRLEVRRIRSRAYRDRHGDVVWLDFAAPHKRTSTWLLMLSSLVCARIPVFRLWALRFRPMAILR
jgi:hypothetical protein